MGTVLEVPLRGKSFASREGADQKGGGIVGIPLNINVQQILLHLFNFVVLATGLYVLLYKPVRSFMDQRIAYYEEQEQHAQKLKEDSEQLQKEHEARMQEMQEEVGKVKAEEMKAVTAKSQQILLHAKEQAAKIKSDADQEAIRNSERIKENAQAEIAKLVITAATKLMIQDKDGENGQAVYDKFLVSVKEGIKDRGEEK